MSLLQSVIALGVLVVCAQAKGFPCSGNTTADDILANVSLAGKFAVVTGGDSGLGFATAKTLARRGATVIIASRNITKAEQAAVDIKASTGAGVLALPLDLSSLASVRGFAAAYLVDVGTTLDILVNNAGIGGPSVESHDGFELVFEVDYLGHFLLTELLLPALRQSAGPARIVNVASGAHEQACESAGWPELCFKDWKYLPPPVVPSRNVTVHYKSGPLVTKSSSYGVAKFLNTQHAAALARREKEAGIEAFSLTPGFALTSMTSHVDPHNPMIKLVCEQQMHPDPSLPTNPCPFSADQGAAVIAYCLSGMAPTSGAYYSRTYACDERPIVMHGFTDEMQLELYSRSLHWVGMADSGTQMPEYV